MTIRYARPESVIFDFDFTLADSSTGTCECVNHAFSRMDLEPVSMVGVSRTIGMSLEKTFRALAPETEWDRADEFSALFVEQADQVMAEMTSVFPSVPAILEVLFGRGLSLGIVSTKFRYRIQGILQREGLERFFRVIVGGEDVSVHKPDPSGLLAAVRALGGSCSRSLYVGDSSTDAETAKAAGVRFMAVLTGTTLRRRNSRIRGRWVFWMIWDNCREFWMSQTSGWQRRLPPFPELVGNSP